MWFFNGGFLILQLTVAFILCYPSMNYPPIGRVYSWIVSTRRTVDPCRRSFTIHKKYQSDKRVRNTQNRISTYHKTISEHLKVAQRDSSSIPVSLPVVHLRNATILDLKLLLEWDDKEHLRDSYGIDEELNDWNWEYELPRKDVPWRYQLIAEVIERDSIKNDVTVPIGFVQIIDPLEEESHYWGIDCEPNLRAIDIWIGEERYINRGYGTQIMKLVLRSSFVFGNSNVTGVLIDPMAENVNAHRFYQRLGFVPVGIRFFGQDECLVHRLDRSEYLLAHPDHCLDNSSNSNPSF